MKKRVMNLVNFVRGCEPRQPWQDLYTPIKEEIAINKSYGFDHTVLLQYDALIRPDMVELMKTEADEHMELGLWFEMGRPLVEAVGIEWRGRPGYDWDWFVNPGFLPAYTPEQREAIIDEAFRLFKELFGYYPRVAGSWLIDTHSLAYMSDKYDMDAFCVCREQFAVDAYTLWGGYYSGGFYPSRKNMLCPAQSPEAGISTPLFRMLGLDPMYGYDEQKYTDKVWGCPTMEPVWGPGTNPDIVDWYLDTYYKNPCLTLSQMTTGQENSFGWDMIQNGYRMQTAKIAALRDKGLISVEKLGDTGAAYQKAHKVTPASALCATTDWTGGDHQSVWYSCANYRVNLFLHENKLFFRDITKFDDRYAERYLTEACTAWDARYDNLPVVDGRLWSKDGKNSELVISRPAWKMVCIERGDCLEINVLFRDGCYGLILLTPERILTQACGNLFYSTGAPDADIAYADGTFSFTYREFPYEIEAKAVVIPEAEGYTLGEQGGKILLEMARK